MVNIPTIPETENLLIHFPRKISLFVTQEQFLTLVVANRDFLGWIYPVFGDEVE